MAYPLSSGGFLRFITIASVLMGAIAMLLHAYLAHGQKYLLRYLLLTYTFGYLIELCGVHTTWPFGEYSYDASLGVSLAGVPLIVPCAWVMMVHPALVAARRVTPQWTFLYGGAILAAWDLFLDPQMVAAGRWSWIVDGAAVPFAPDIPLSNPFGWLLSGLLIVGLLNRVLPFERRKESTGTGAVTVLLGWVLFSGLVGNLFFFDRPGLAIFASLIFGALVAPFIFKSTLGES
jgi:putative membrane protein